MGDRLAGRHAGQHPDLSTRPLAAAQAGPFRTLILTLLALDGVLVGILGAFFLPVYLGRIPFPIAAVVAGLANLALVWAASQWATGRMVMLPLMTFMATVVVFLFGGPGSDAVFGGTGVLAAGPLLLIVLGCGPALWWLWRGGVR